MQELIKILDRWNRGSASWASLREVRERTTLRHARDQKMEATDSSESHGVMAEVLVNGQFAYAATPTLHPASILAALDAAREQAEAASRHRVFAFTQAHRPPHSLRYESPVQRPLHTVTPTELTETLIRITQKLKLSPKTVRTTASAQTVESWSKWVSTSGAQSEQNFLITSIGFNATVQDGSIIQTRSLGGHRGYSYQGGWEHFFIPDLWERVQEIGEQAIELVESAEECPTESTSLVLMPDQMMLQIHESIGHPLEMDRILGDERNYAGWSFVRLEDFGSLQYGSSLMNVSFDPTVPHEIASYAMDDHGVPAKKEFLIQNGKLVRGLGGIESQARSGLPGVSNARACSWNRPPMDRMANLNLEPGTSSMEEIIGSIPNGILMETNRSWSIDDFRNKFQFGCEYAKRIENGRITRTLRNPNYRGVTVPFWNSLKKVGNADTFRVYGTPNCGKGEPNQVIRVGHASPVCLFEGVEVFGGA